MDEKKKAEADAAPRVRIGAAFAAALQHHQAGRLDEADRLYRQILGADPNHVDSLHLLGVAAHQRGNHAAAVELMRRAIARNDRHPALQHNIAEAYRALGRLSEAAAHYARALALNPNFAEAHLNLGITLQERGDLAEAAAHYLRALALRPGLPQAHNNLGNVFWEQGRLDEAISSYELALQAKPDYAEAQSNLGTALSEQGRFEEAVACYERALALRPDYAEAHIHLGNALHAQGKLEAAISAYRRALAIAPDFTEVHNNLGNALQEQGRLGAAIVSYRRALALKPDYAEAHNNLADAYKKQGRQDEAMASYLQALSLKPDLVEAHLSLARLYLAKEETSPALGLLARALKLRESLEAKALFVHCLKTAQRIPDTSDVRQMIRRALSEPWGRPDDLAPVAKSLVKTNGLIADGIKRAASAWPRRLPMAELLGPSGLAALAEDELLPILLQTTPVQDIELEWFLTSLRCGLLATAEAAAATPIGENVLRLHCALARQCFINEYVFATAEAEVERARQLRDSLAADLAAGAPTPPLALAAVAAYFPLHSLTAAESVLERSWPNAVAELLAQQVAEPREERLFERDILSLTGIDDAVSLQVKQQYEENPYPRWIKVVPARRALTIDEQLHGAFPLAAFRDLGKKNEVEILIAGCGTGRQAIETAQRTRGARILAVDLSLPSLCYARRKTRELGLTNIDYAQADILQLGSFDRRFDVIETTGVLHHLAKPMAGWRVLLRLLRPGGFMRVGLYSALARQDIVAARAFIAARSYGRTAAEIRRCRQDIMSLEQHHPVKRVMAFGDFFSTSGCRDLLFHVQEHQLTLPEIRNFMVENNLSFIGFEQPAQIAAQISQRYKARFPADAAMCDLESWDIFERENPFAFSSMYIFWVQKTAHSSLSQNETG